MLVRSSFHKLGNSLDDRSSFCFNQKNLRTLLVNQRLSEARLLITENSRCCFWFFFFPWNKIARLENFNSRCQTGCGSCASCALRLSLYPVTVILSPASDTCPEPAQRFFMFQLLYRAGSFSCLFSSRWPLGKKKNKTTPVTSNTALCTKARGGKKFLKETELFLQVLLHCNWQVHYLHPFIIGSRITRALRHALSVFVTDVTVFNFSIAVYYLKNLAAIREYHWRLACLRALHNPLPVGRKNIKCF